MANHNKQQLLQDLRSKMNWACLAWRHQSAGGLMDRNTAILNCGHSFCSQCMEKAEQLDLSDRYCGYCGPGTPVEYKWMLSDSGDSIRKVKIVRNRSKTITGTMGIGVYEPRIDDRMHNAEPSNTFNTLTGEGPWNNQGRLVYQQGASDNEAPAANFVGQGNTLGGRASAGSGNRGRGNAGRGRGGPGASTMARRNNDTSGSTPHGQRRSTGSGCKVGQGRGYWR